MFQTRHLGKGASASCAASDPFSGQLVLEQVSGLYIMQAVAVGIAALACMWGMFYHLWYVPYAYGAAAVRGEDAEQFLGFWSRICCGAQVSASLHHHTVTARLKSERFEYDQSFSRMVKMQLEQENREAGEEDDVDVPGEGDLWGNSSPQSPIQAMCLDNPEPCTMQYHGQKVSGDSRKPSTVPAALAIPTDMDRQPSHITASLYPVNPGASCARDSEMPPSVSSLDRTMTAVLSSEFSQPASVRGTSIFSSPLQHMSSGSQRSPFGSPPDVPHYGRSNGGTAVVIGSMAAAVLGKRTMSLSPAEAASLPRSGGILRNATSTHDAGSSSAKVAFVGTTFSGTSFAGSSFADAAWWGSSGSPGVDAVTPEESLQRIRRQSAVSFATALTPRLEQGEKQMGHHDVQHLTKSNPQMPAGCPQDSPELPDGRHNSLSISHHMKGRQLRVFRSAVGQEASVHIHSVHRVPACSNSTSHNISATLQSMDMQVSELKNSHQIKSAAVPVDTINSLAQRPARDTLLMTDSQWLHAEHLNALYDESVGDHASSGEDDAFTYPGRRVQKPGV